MATYIFCYSFFLIVFNKLRMICNNIVIIYLKSQRGSLIKHNYKLILIPSPFPTIIAICSNKFFVLKNYKMIKNTYAKEKIHLKFKINEIVSEETKFNYLVSQLELKYLRYRDK